jgi:hypothetical protein
MEDLSGVELWLAASAGSPSAWLSSAWRSAFWSAPHRDASRSGHGHEPPDATCAPPPGAPVARPTDVHDGNPSVPMTSGIDPAQSDSVGVSGPERDQEGYR